jgi:hypothetical protein
VARFDAARRRGLIAKPFDPIAPPLRVAEILG